jgi:hypothetical protein
MPVGKSDVDDKSWMRGRRRGEVIMSRHKSIMLLVAGVLILALVLPAAAAAGSSSNAAEAPAMQLGNIYQTNAHTIGIIMQNAVSAQQQSNVTFQAATTMGVSTLYSLDDAAEGTSAASLLDWTDPAGEAPHYRISSGQ